MRKRDIFIVAGAMGLAIALTAWALLTAVVETGSWGLSYRTEGQPPSGPLDRQARAELGAV